MKVLKALDRARRLKRIYKALESGGQVTLTPEDKDFILSLKKQDDLTIKAYPARVQGRRSSRIAKEDSYWRARRKEQTDRIMKEVKEYLAEEGD
jgi:hypothetical protein